MTDFFWNEDDWFLFARDYLRLHISCDDSVLEAVRKSVDLFEKPSHWEPEYRDWQEQRRNNGPGKHTTSCPKCEFEWSEPQEDNGEKYIPEHYCLSQGTDDVEDDWVESQEESQ